MRFDIAVAVAVILMAALFFTFALITQWVQFHARVSSKQNANLTITQMVLPAILWGVFFWLMIIL